MILFSSNHHHSHILSQSILYHYIYSININSQFQTLFFRQTINSYLLHLSYSHSLSNHLYFIHMLSYSLLSSILLSIFNQLSSSHRFQISISFFFSILSAFHPYLVLKHSFLIRDYYMTQGTGLKQ